MVSEETESVNRINISENDVDGRFQPSNEVLGGYVILAGSEVQENFREQCRYEPQEFSMLPPKENAIVDAAM